MKKLKAYPTWVCHDCGYTAQPDKARIFELSTMHAGVCGVCEKIKAVTEPRDYGYPKFKGHKHV